MYVPTIESETKVVIHFIHYVADTHPQIYFLGADTLDFCSTIVYWITHLRYIRMHCYIDNCFIGHILLDIKCKNLATTCGVKVTQHSFRHISFLPGYTKARTRYYVLWRYAWQLQKGLNWYEFVLLLLHHPKNRMRK